MKCAVPLRDAQVMGKITSSEADGVGSSGSVVPPCSRPSAALNFVCRLSRTAVAQCGIEEAVRGYKAKIVCSRKDDARPAHPGEYAARAGGRANHRFELGDAVLIKDNHVAVAGPTLNERCWQAHPRTAE